MEHEVPAPVRASGLAIVHTGRAVAPMADLTAGFGTVLSRGSFVWWSEGGNESLTWRVLDLRTIEASA
ncbi:hypothetical protein [Amycolatopsis sp. WAC 04182]|uniref:hypothetical protein n=1 Tax=Amycolatopsis sp. WAC 04182 TaxID=2203198 RepID=UPI000F7670D5|nr:hypothetical protein [Amycolatopsis sp. WAC 04182]